MGHAIPIAAQAGVSLEELSASIAVLTARGQNTAEAVTAIRASIVELLKPSENLQKIYKAIGVTSGEALIDQYGFAGALKKVSEKATKLNIPLQDVFANIRSMQAALPLASDASDDLAKAMEEMKTAAGATDEAYKKMAATFDFLKSQVLQSFKVIMIDIGETILPDVQKAFENLRDNMPEIREKIIGVAEGFKKVIEWTVEHGDLIKIIIGVGIAFKTASLGVVLFKLAINPVGAAIVVVTGALLGLTAALKAQKKEIDVIENWADTYLEMADNAKTLADKESALFVIEAQLANLRSAMEAGEITGADYIAESINVEALKAAITQLESEIAQMTETSKKSTIITEKQTDAVIKQSDATKQLMTDKEALKIIESANNTIFADNVDFQIMKIEQQAEIFREMKLNEVDIAKWAEDAKVGIVRDGLIKQNVLYKSFEAGYNQFINTLTDAEMTGKERKEKIWEATKNAFVRFAGELLKEWIVSLIAREVVAKSSQVASIAAAHITGAAIASAYAVPASLAATASFGGSAAAGLAGITASVAATKAMAAFATGGDFVTSGPQMIVVGDNPGGREHVSVTPMSSPNINGPNNSSVSHNYSINIYANDSKSFEDFLNGAGRQPTIEFIEKVSYRREL